MSPFKITDTPLTGLKVVERKCKDDGRGFLSRLFCAEELALAGWEKSVVQINHTYTAELGTVRGMHLQCPPHAEMKLVSCLRGEVWDVAVDVRCGSATFRQWYAVTLSAENNRALLVPEGFAHGFQTLTDAVELLYCHSAGYEPAAEVGLNPLDEGLAISWPLPVTRISARDRAHPFIDARFAGVRL